MIVKDIRMFDELWDILNNNQSFLIISHISPDGDTVGSAIVLYLMLTSLHKQAILFCKDKIPKNLLFLPCIDQYQSTDAYLPHCDVCITVDCSDFQRTGLLPLALNQYKCSVNIDHHPSNTRYATLNIVNSTASATGEIIYHAMSHHGISLNDFISECIYTAISTDTGNFSNANTTSDTHNITSKLLQYKIDVSKISSLLYHNYSVAKTKLIGCAISSLDICCDNRLAFITITEDMMNTVLALDSDCEGIINVARDIENVEVAVLIKEQAEYVYKVSFRSREYIDVSKIAQTFNGGGHKRAAGCTINGHYIEIKDKLTTLIKNEIILSRSDI